MNPVVEECIRLLRRDHIKVVAFDMDQTAVAMLSRGRLRRNDLQFYISKASPAFSELIPALFDHGFGPAIATHSDEAEFSGDVKRETHILGSELAKALVDTTFPAPIARSFFIVAYNPRWHFDGMEENKKIKRHHMEEIKSHFGVDAKEILFFDDTEIVVEDCNKTCGVRTIAVDPSEAFQLSDLLNGLIR